MDEFTRRLWQIYETVHTEGVAQDLQLGIHRSDYMFDVGNAVNGQLGDPSEFRLIQIEINTIASAFGCLSTRLYNTHRRILRRLDDTIGGGVDDGSGSGFDNRDAVPQNHVSENLAKAMLLAVEHYRQSRAARIKKTTTAATDVDGCVCSKKKKLAILFLDTEVVRNVFDSRLLERAIDDQLGGDQVVVIRKTLKQVETEAHLDEETKLLTVNGFEVALAYFRVGYSPDNYPSGLWRLLLLRLLLFLSFDLSLLSINLCYSIHIYAPRQTPILIYVLYFLCTNSIARAEEVMPVCWLVCF